MEFVKKFTLEIKLEAFVILIINHHTKVLLSLVYFSIPSLGLKLSHQITFPTNYYLFLCCLQWSHPTYYFEVHRCVKSRLQEHPSPPIVSPPLLMPKTASQFLGSALITRQLECKKVVALCPFLVFLLLHNFPYSWPHHWAI